MGIASTIIDLEERDGQQLSKGSAQMRKPASILQHPGLPLGTFIHQNYHNGYDTSYGPQYLWNKVSGIMIDGNDQPGTAEVDRGIIFMSYSFFNLQEYLLPIHSLT